jgi:hypothetical protein
MQRRAAVALARHAAGAQRKRKANGNESVIISNGMALMSASASRNRRKCVENEMAAKEWLSACNEISAANVAISNGINVIERK